MKYIDKYLICFFFFVFLSILSCEKQKDNVIVNYDEIVQYEDSSLIIEDAVPYFEEKSIIAYDDINDLYKNIISIEYENISDLYINTEYYDELESILYKTHYNRSNYNNAIDYYLQAMELYNKFEYDNAIYYLIEAWKSYNFCIIYYQLGLCLMNLGDYNLARAAFEKNIKNFTSIPFYFTFMSNIDREDLYSRDNNGIIRERYFSYYNIACIESLRNNIDVAYKYLVLAILHGYPYITHLKSDSDLENFIDSKSGKNLELIEQLYNLVRKNQVAGLGFNRSNLGGFDEYYFINDHILVAYFFGGGVRASTWIYANYEIRGDTIFVDKINYPDDVNYPYYDGFQEETFTISLDKLLNTYEIVSVEIGIKMYKEF